MGGKFDTMLKLLEFAVMTEQSSSLEGQFFVSWVGILDIEYLKFPILRCSASLGAVTLTN